MRADPCTAQSGYSGVRAGVTTRCSVRALIRAVVAGQHVLDRLLVVS